MELGRKNRAMRDISGSQSWAPGRKNCLWVHGQNKELMERMLSWFVRGIWKSGRQWCLEPMLWKLWIQIAHKFYCESGSSHLFLMVKNINTERFLQRWAFYSSQTGIWMGLSEYAPNSLVLLLWYNLSFWAPPLKQCCLCFYFHVFVWKEHWERMKLKIKYVVFMFHCSKLGSNLIVVFYLYFCSTDECGCDRRKRATTCVLISWRRKGVDYHTNALDFFW